MKSKKYLFMILGLIVILLIGILLYVKYNVPKVKIERYELGTENLINAINITSFNDIKLVENFIENIKFLEDNEKVNLALPVEVVVMYKEDIKLSLSLNNEYYCYYINASENVNELIKMPKGLYEWTLEKLK